MQLLLVRGQLADVAGEGGAQLFGTQGVQLPQYGKGAGRVRTAVPP
ncbi:hypothetical protein [Streptomyces sp. NPDC004830]